MKKIALAFASLFATAPAFAGPYVNVESNASYTGDQYNSRITDFHVGYEGKAGESVDWYIQGGPAVVAEQGSDSDGRLSGKTGLNISATDQLDFYGEISVLTADADTDNDNAWGTKVGVKYSF